MSILEKYDKIFQAKDEAGMNEILHDDFKFTMHSSGNQLSKTDVIGWAMSDDISEDRDGKLEFCGDTSLKKHMLDLKPKLCLFGHIYNCEDIINAGTMKLSVSDTIYSNGSVVTDGKFGKLSSNGNVIFI